MLLARILINALTIVALDSLWLMLIGKRYKAAVAAIQGGAPAVLTPLYALPVYLALGYILTVPQSWQQAFFLGLCTYAVYDFTVLALFARFPWPLAVMDTLWGGILLSAAYLITTNLMSKSKSKT